MAEPAIEKAFLAESIEEALNEEREKYAQEEENRVVRLIKKGKSLDDILDFSSLPPERVQQLFTENQK